MHRNRTYLTNQRKSGVLVRNYLHFVIGFYFLITSVLAHKSCYIRFPWATLQPLTQTERDTAMEIPPGLNKEPGLFQRKLWRGEATWWTEDLICSVTLDSSEKSTCTVYFSKELR